MWADIGKGSPLLAVALEPQHQVLPYQREGGGLHGIEIPHEGNGVPGVLPSIRWLD
jgi:hypothetical protein